MSFAATTARPATLYKSSLKSATGQQRRVITRHSSKGAAFAFKGSAAFCRRSTQTVSALPVTELAVAPVFPSLLSLAFRLASAGFLLYSSLQWASARNSRIQVQRNIKDQEQRQSEQKRKLDRLRGITQQDDKQE